MRFLASSLTPSWNFVCFLLAIFFLAWLCQDYPSWRRKRLEQNRTIQTENIASQKYDHSETAPQTSTGSPKSGELSILQYILAMPIASIYVVARATLDTIRSLIFWTLWGLEKSAPYLDDWLFDILTAWLPNKFRRLDQWWTKRGSVLWQNIQRYMMYHIIPKIIHGIERLISALVRLGGALHKVWVDLKSVWQTFVEFGVEWRKIITDFIEDWVVPAAARIWRLGAILYGGSIRIAWSVWQDISWITVVVLPVVLNAIAATRLYHFFRSSASTGVAIAHWMVYKLIIPLVWTLQPVALKAMGVVVIILQSRSFQRRWMQVRKALSIRMVWFVLEVFEHLESFVRFLHLVFVYVLLPAVACYTQDIHPRISRAYHQWMGTLVHTVLLPTWIIIQPYLNTLFTLVHNVLSVPIEALWTFIQRTAWQGWDLGQKIGIYLGSIAQTALRSLWPSVQVIYSHIAIWLEKQMPAMTRACQLVWDLVASYDWITLWTQIIQWSTVQGEAVFSSFERVLTDWIKDQVPQDVDEPMLKKTN